MSTLYITYINYSAMCTTLQYTWLLCAGQCVQQDHSYTSSSYVTSDRSSTTNVGTFPTNSSVSMKYIQY